MKRREGSMANWTAEQLAAAVVDVLCQRCVHKRGDWVTLMGHRRNYEEWWKAEFVSAVESWAWSSECNDQLWGALPEPMPKKAGYKIWSGDGKADILVAPWDDQTKTVAIKNAPRVWIELKHRNTEYGVSKTFYKGLESDIDKWSGAQWTTEDVVLACHLLVHDATDRESLPQIFRARLDEIGKKYPRFCSTFYVGYKLTDSVIRWLNVDFFRIYPLNPTSPRPYRLRRSRFTPTRIGDI